MDYGSCPVQQQGIDKRVILTHGKKIGIDTKFTSYGDYKVFCEYMSVVEKDKIGWVADPTKLCDYIAYFWRPRNQVALIPFDALQRAWFEFGPDWAKTYGERTASTNYYGTVYTSAGVPVPLEVIQTAINEVNMVTVSKGI